MFAAGIVSPLVGIGGGSYGYTNGDYNAGMCSAFLIVLVWFGEKNNLFYNVLRVGPQWGPTTTEY